MARKREYVHTEQLAARIEEWLVKHAAAGETLQSLARAAGVSPKAIRKILARERPYQSVWLADKLLIATGGSLYELDTVWLQPSQNAIREKALTGA